MIPSVSWEILDKWKSPSSVFSFQNIHFPNILSSPSYYLLHKGNLKFICPRTWLFFHLSRFTDWLISQHVLTSKNLLHRDLVKCLFCYISYWESPSRGNNIGKGLEAGRSSGWLKSIVTCRLSAKALAVSGSASWVYHDQLCELRWVIWCEGYFYFCELG